jgi:uroporphyrinogen-III synthase
MAQKKNKASKSKTGAAKNKSTKKAASSRTIATAKSAAAKNNSSASKKKVVKPAAKTPVKPASKPASKKPLTRPAAKPAEKPVIALAKVNEDEKKQAAVKVSKATKAPSNPGPQYVEADKNSPRVKVRTILISQPKPESEKNPFLDIARKYNVKINFRQFIQIDPVPAREFRQQRINLTEHNAVILTSRVAIDHYFRMCNEMRYTVPETTKYFCLTESIAYYLQKYVQYRKRKIFFGQQSINDLVDVIKKHKEEKFLLPVSDVHRERIVDFLDDMKLNYSKATFYRTVCADLSDFQGKLDYDAVIFFTPMGIQSLQKNFPHLKQGNLRIGAFGPAACKALKDAGFRLDIAAPTKEAPSMATAIENYIREVNKR